MSRYPSSGGHPRPLIRHSIEVLIGCSDDLISLLSRRRSTCVGSNQLVGNDQTDTGRDGRTCLAKPISQARMGTGKNHFPCSADHEQGWQSYPVDPYPALQVMTIHTLESYCVRHQEKKQKKNIQALTCTCSRRTNCLYCTMVQDTVHHCLYRTQYCMYRAPYHPCTETCIVRQISPLTCTAYGDLLSVGPFRTLLQV